MIRFLKRRKIHTKIRGYLNIFIQIGSEQNLCNFFLESSLGLCLECYLISGIDCSRVGFRSLCPGEQQISRRVYDRNIFRRLVAQSRRNISRKVFGNPFGKRIVKFQPDACKGFLLLGQKRSVIVRYGECYICFLNILRCLHDFLQVRFLIQLVGLLLVGFGC